jgi:hypothetical protein
MYMLPRGGTVRRTSISAPRFMAATSLDIDLEYAAARNATPLRENIEKHEAPKVAAAPASWTPWPLPRSLRVFWLRFSFWVCVASLFTKTHTEHAKTPRKQAI